MHRRGEPQEWRPQPLRKKRTCQNLLAFLGSRPLRRCVSVCLRMLQVYGREKQTLKKKLSVGGPSRRKIGFWMQLAQVIVVRERAQRFRPFFCCLSVRVVTQLPRCCGHRVLEHRSARIRSHWKVVVGSLRGSSLVPLLVFLCHTLFIKETKMGVRPFHGTSCNSFSSVVVAEKYGHPSDKCAGIRARDPPLC